MGSFTRGVGGLPVDTITNVPVSATTYTVLPTDWTKQIETSSGSATTITFNAASLAGVRAGEIILITQGGAGLVTLTGSGVTLRNVGVFGQYITLAFQLKANGEVWGI
jgi:hypothetical protein